MLLGLCTVTFVFLSYLHNDPAYQQAIDFATNQTVIREQLGEVHVNWWGYGSISTRQNGGYAQLTIPLHGSKGAGTLWLVETYRLGQWMVEEAVFAKAGSQEMDVTPTVRPESDLPGNGTVYLVPMGDLDPDTLAGLPEYYNQRFHLEVKILPSVPITGVEEDHFRHQVIAESMGDVLKRSVPLRETEPSAIVLGVTNRDMYIRSLDWRFAYNYRTDDMHLAVISAARMQRGAVWGKNSPAVRRVRLRKMITKNIGLLRYRLPFSTDPTSVLNVTVTSEADLDLMGEDFTGADGQWHSYITHADACVSVWRYPDGHMEWKAECTYNPPEDPRIETFENDLTAKIAVQERTDFYWPEDFPLQLVRKHHPQDKAAYAFGVGANHSMNMWLYGAPEGYTSGDFILADNARMHFVRTSPGLDRDHAVFRIQGMWRTPYEKAEIHWSGDGWELVRNDGWHINFPDISKARLQPQAAIIGIHDEKGHNFEIVRAENGDLQRIVSPWGSSLDLEYDSSSRITRAWDNHGRSIDYEYDPDGRLAKVFCSDGNVEQYAYDAAGQMTDIRDGSGTSILHNEYDSSGLLTRQVLGDGRELNYTYQWRSARQGEVTLRDPEGFETKFSIFSGGFTLSLPHR